MKRKLTAFAAAFALAALAGIAHAQQTPASQPAKAENAAERKPIYYRNPMGLPDISPVPKKDSMGMDYIPVYSDEASASAPGTVNISLDRVQRTGVRTERAEQRLLVRPVRAPGVVALDERRIFVISLRFDGFVEKVEDVTTGSHVKAGEPLMTIYAPDLLKIGGRLVVEGETGWGPGTAASRTTLNERSLRSSVVGARRLLENMGVPNDYIDAIVRTREVPNTIVWRSPRDGIVLERTAVEGMRAQAGEELFRIADHSVVWVMTQVSEGELGAVKAGQPATVRPRARPGQEFHGKVAVVYPHLNKEIRTGSIRIELPNPDLALLPDMYADVEIDTGAGEHPRLSVPNSSIIDSGNAQVVLVARGEGRFEPRNVALGLRGQDYTEVTSGIAAGDEVVVAANFLIDAESNLKAALSAFSADAATKAAPARAAPPPPSATAPDHSHGSNP